MKIELRSTVSDAVPCIDWAVAITVVRCRGNGWWAIRTDAQPDKAYVVSALWPIGAVMVSKLRTHPSQSTNYLTPDEIDRLMAGEDL